MPISRVIRVSACEDRREADCADAKIVRCERDRSICRDFSPSPIDVHELIVRVVPAIVPADEELRALRFHTITGFTQCFLKRARIAHEIPTPPSASRTQVDGSGTIKT